jgi:acyl-CoA synthetase (AMP-forming)/AMP-acid ligase II
MRLADTNLVLAENAQTTISELIAASVEHVELAGRNVLFVTADPFAQLRAVLACATVGLRAGIVPDEAAADAAESTGAFELVVRRGGVHPARRFRASEDGSGGVYVLTSGSTGSPKAVLHPLERLDTFGHVRIGGDFCWLAGYRAGTYAWYQVVLLGLTRPGQALVLAESSGPGALVRRLLAGTATALSSTPTFYRYLLVAVPRERLQVLPLAQVTLGGEPVEQSLLERVRAAFPAASVTHVYATTEAGPVLSASDGRAGYPLPTHRHGRPNVKIEDGALLVCSPWSVAGNDAWVETGDRAELVGGRVYIVGRVHERIANVGGQKVALRDVERVVEELECVAWARARAVRSPLTGELVAMDVVPTTPGSADVEAAVRTACRERLGDAAEPRRVRLLSEVPLGPGLKTVPAA